MPPKQSIHTPLKNAVSSIFSWRDTLKYKVGSRFAFSGNIISKVGSSLTMSVVYTIRKARAVVERFCCWLNCNANMQYEFL